MVDRKMTEKFGLNELKQVIQSFLQTSRVSETIEFKEPLKLSKAEVLELVKMFGKMRSSLVSSRGDLWTELLNFGNVFLLIVYENPDYKTFLIHKIELRREENAE